MMISTSTPKSSGMAEDLDDAADGAVAVVAETRAVRRYDHAVQVLRVTRTSTGRTRRCGSPAFAGGIAMPSGISIHWLDALVVRHDVECRAGRRGTRRPRSGARASATSTISPSARPSRPMRAMRTTTRSPCMAFSAASGGRKMSPSMPSIGWSGNHEAVAVAMHAQAPGESSARRFLTLVIAAVAERAWRCEGALGID